MAIIHDEAQWLILLGLIVSFAILFLALVINQSILVGQTTAESALEFPKTEIFDLRSQIREIAPYKISSPPDYTQMIEDITDISIQRKGAIVFIYDLPTPECVIHYNNGITSYDETITEGYYDTWDF